MGDCFSLVLSSDLQTGFVNAVVMTLYLLIPTDHSRECRQDGLRLERQHETNRVQIARAPWVCQ